MPSVLNAIFPYAPPPVVRAALMHPHPQPREHPATAEVVAAVLFADVSGFTPLTEALARKGAEGPEELTRLLNGYFGAMIECLDAEGGEVVKFSGDALTVLFTATNEPLSHAIRRAYQAALRMQQAMADFTTLSTSVGPVRLAMKIGIGAGLVKTFEVGGFFGRWEYVVAGDPLRQVAEAEHLAHPGDILLSPEAQIAIWPLPLAPSPLQAPNQAQILDTQALISALVGYLPASARTWLNSGLADWIAVLRPMSVIFAGVGGLDYASPTVLDQVQTFLHAVQAVVYRYEGSINKLVVDDKGTVVMALFGAPPFAHSDDPSRAVRCALDMQRALATQSLRMAVGVATGLVFAGPVGSDTRREYTVMGDTVNLAARLMATSTRSHELHVHDDPTQCFNRLEVVCDATTAAAAHRDLTFAMSEPVKLKGKAEPMPLFRPGPPTSITHKQLPADQQPGLHRIFGRDAELARIKAAATTVLAGGCATISIEGEAGLGKSRLLEEAEQYALSVGLQRLRGAGLSIERETPYRAWRTLLEALFQLAETSTIGERRAEVVALIERTAPELIDRLPLLNEVLGLDVPDTPALKPLTLAARHQLRVGLIVDLIRRSALTHPLALIIEDAHWLDSLSWELALAVERALSVAHVPLFMLMTTRPMESSTISTSVLTLLAMPQTERIVLAPLDQEAITGVAAGCLGLTPEGLPVAIADLISQRSGGNPFFAEELALAMRDKGLIVIEHTDDRPTCIVIAQLAQIAHTLPPTVQGVVLSRIDRLIPEHQLTLKVGAVIGQTFSYYPLYAALTSSIEVREAVLLEWLGYLATRDLTLPEGAQSERVYVFKHNITREVAYGTLLFAQRRRLHRAIAEWYEQPTSNPHDAAPAMPAQPPPSTYLLLNLLAYHWEQAGEPTKAIHYLEQAGAQALTANALREARAYSERALQLIDTRPDAERDPQALIRLHRQLGLALWYSGELAAARVSLEASLVHARATGSEQAAIEALTYLGRVVIEMGAYDAARRYLEEAIAAAGASGDHAGRVLALRYLGMVALNQGEYTTAQAQLDEAMVAAQGNNDRYSMAHILTSLGTIALFADRYAEARSSYERSLALARALDHRWSMAIALGNLGEVAYREGNYAAALAYNRSSLAIDRAIGNRDGVAMTLNNMGEVACERGDYNESARCFHEGIPTALEIGGLRTVLYGLCSVARLLTRVGDTPLALRLLGLVLHHPASNSDVQGQANQVVNELKTLQPAATINAGLSGGANAELEALVGEVVEQLRQRF